MHVVQYGAQNQSTTAEFEYPARSIDPPPMSGAVQSYATGVVADFSGDSAVAADSASGGDGVEVDGTGSTATVGSRNSFETPSPSSVAHAEPRRARTHTVEEAKRYFMAEGKGTEVSQNSPSVRNLTAVKTRTLLLLSVGCAVAILGAGIGLVFRIGSTGETSAPIEFGVRAEVGDLNITVLDAERIGTQQHIKLTLSGVDDGAVSDSFVVISSGEQVMAEANTCASSTELSRSCEVEFVLPDETSDPAVLLVTRGEERARWVLAPSADAIP